MSDQRPGADTVSHGLWDLTRRGAPKGETNGPRVDEIARLVRLGEQLRTLVTNRASMKSSTLLRWRMKPSFGFLLAALAFSDQLRTTGSGAITTCAMSAPHFRPRSYCGQISTAFCFTVGMLLPASKNGVLIIRNVVIDRRFVKKERKWLLRKSCDVLGHHLMCVS
jgi:hypothetical protein